MKKILLATLMILSSPLPGETTDIKIKDVNTKDDTAIYIKKGAPAADQCVEYQIVEGNEPIPTTPQYDKSKAYAEWKTNCSEWKKEVRDLHKTNSLLSLSCGKPNLSKEGEQFTYESNGTYRSKVKMKEKEK